MGISVNEIPVIKEKGVWVGEGYASFTKGNEISYAGWQVRRTAGKILKVKHFHSIQKNLRNICNIKKMDTAVNEITPKSCPKQREFLTNPAARKQWINPRADEFLDHLHMLMSLRGYLHIIGEFLCPYLSATRTNTSQ